MKYFERIAKFCQKTYGVPYYGQDRCFICPECGEPLYEEDYNDEDFILEDKFGCPICDYNYCSIYEV